MYSRCLLINDGVKLGTWDEFDLFELFGVHRDLEFRTFFNQ